MMLATPTVITPMVQQQFFVHPQLGDDQHPGTVEQPLQTITAAIAKTTAGDKIHLAAGEYTTQSGEVFPLIIPTGVTLRGNEANQGEDVIIRGHGIFKSDRLGSQQVTLVLQTDSILRGVTVMNPHPKGSGIWLEDGRVNIENNRLQWCGREAILVCADSKPIIVDNQFSDNEGNGIFLVNYAKGEIRHNHFHKNHYAIATNESAAPLISHNRFSQNQVGIFIAKQSCPVLRRNIITANQKVGIVVSGEAQPDLGSQQDPAGNVIRDNGTADLRNKTNFVLVSVGNDLNPKTSEGMVEFLAADREILHTEVAPFRDVADHWAEPFIQVLAAAQCLQGFADGTFRPDALVTRAEFATLLAQCFDLPRPLGIPEVSFVDVPADFGAAQAIAKAVSMGFLVGYPDGSFRPHVPLTKLQTLMALAKGLGLRDGNPKVLQAFGDRPQIPSHALNLIAAATQHRLIVNYPKVNRLEPLRLLTRGELAALLHQALVIHHKLPVLYSELIVDPLPFLPTFSDVTDHWAKPFITAIANLGLVQGHPDGSFKPDQPLTRAEFATIVSDIFAPHPVRPAASFFDVPDTDPAASAIQRSYRGGFLSGFPDQTFHPQQRLRRVHVLLAIANGLQLPPANLDVLALYEDREDIPDYAKNVVAAATHAGIVVNYPDRNFLKAQAIATRAQVIALCYQALVYLNRAPLIESNSIVQL